MDTAVSTFSGVLKNSSPPFGFHRGWMPPSRDTWKREPPLSGNGAT